MLRSTLCVSGEGTALVCAVGENTLSGRADAILNIDADLTPLQKKLETIANQIGKLGMLVALMTFIAMIVRTLLTVFIFAPVESGLG